MAGVNVPSLFAILATAVVHGWALYLAKRCERRARQLGRMVALGRVQQVVRSRGQVQETRMRQPEVTMTNKGAYQRREHPVLRKFCWALSSASNPSWKCTFPSACWGTSEFPFSHSVLKCLLSWQNFFPTSGLTEAAENAKGRTKNSSCAITM